jgi:hypothetical protein
MVSVPVGGGLVNSMFPDTEKVPVRGSHEEVSAVIEIIEQ